MTTPEDSDTAAVSPPADETASAWLPVLAGLLAATAAAWYAQPGLLARLPFLESLLALLSWLAVTAIAGAAAMAIGRRSLLGRSAPLWQPVLDALPAWILLPPLLLLAARQSPWALAFTALSSAALGAIMDERAPGNPEAETAEMRSALFAGLPPPEPGRPQAFLVSASIEGALALLIARHWIPGGVLLALGSFLLSGRIATAAVTKYAQGPQRSAARAGAAAMLALVFLLPLLMTGGGGFFGNARAAAQVRHRPSRAAKTPAAAPDMGYRGIILWPVAPKEQPLVAPVVQTRAFSPHAARPLVIPFDGDYWYFQAPRHGPGINPHVAHGDPVAVSISSASWIPLAMQAHQSLASPVNLSCCNRLEVTVENGDNREGSIALGVVLRDSARPGKPFLFLNPETIVSTEPAHFALKTHPVEETLRFPIPRKSSIRQFDEITVVYFPSDARATLGARVSIRRFELLPR
jgi:hypothetical protein